MGVSTAARLVASRSTLSEGHDGGNGGFSGLLDGFRERLDRELEDWLAAKRREAGSLLGAGPGPTGMVELIDGVGRLMTGGGKRLRPALVYYTYRGCGGTSDAAVLPVALATELLHTYLLIHDDI